MTKEQLARKIKIADRIARPGVTGVPVKIDSALAIAHRILDFLDSQGSIATQSNTVLGAQIAADILRNGERGGRLYPQEVESSD